MNEDWLKNRGFSARKLALLATLLDEEGVRQAPALKRISRDIELPLSSAQMRLWLFDQLEPGSSAYNIPVRHDFKGPFDIAALERSLSEIVRRHEALRTCYLSLDGTPVQKIAVAELLRIPVVNLQDDLHDLPELAREQKVASLALAFARQPFDLGNAPLLRAQVLKLAPDEHVLLLNVHHIAFDWWSMGVFENELAALYEAFLHGEQSSPLPDLPLQYVDFTAWQQERLKEEILQEQLDYWRTKLSGELPTLELPTDRPRPAIQTYNGTFVCSALSQNLTEALKTLSQREGTTLFATLLGAFQVLLQRYTGENDILVGAPIAARNRAEIEGLIGFFVNTLVMRTDLSGDPTFRELLRRVQETTLGAYSHQDLPFEKLVEALNPKRDSSRSPIFQVMLSMLNTPMQPLQLPGVQHRRTILDSGTSKFDLTLYAIEEPAGLSFTCEYNTDLFDSDRIQRMLGHLEVLLESIVDDPDRHLSELAILTERERQQILVGWNDTQMEYPQDMVLQQLFEGQVEKTPEAVAVEYDGAQLTYRELNQRANQLAHYLSTQGVRAEILVGICMERSLEMVIALLGVLKAGGAYVPLDPAYPRERLAFMMEDAQIGMLLTRDVMVTGLPEVKTVNLNSDAEEIARQSATNPISTVPSTSLAYVLYTSGSTGKSKGVQISHRSVVNFLTSMRRQPGLTEKDVLLSVTTLSFDIAALEIFLPLTVGARLVLVSREVASDGARLSEQLAKSGATVMQATPATWRLLLAAGWQGSQRLRILCGGEALDRELANQLLKKCSALWNMYGPTETTIWSAVYKVESEAESDLKTVAIGRPIANTQLYLLDRHLQPVPVGVTGELHIGGEGLARGYLNRPELTTEKFIPNPFIDDAGTRLSARLYKTGDLGRYLPDGAIDFLGRNDYQVKIRGFRIELGEIEAALDRHPGVQKAVVVAREDAPGDQRLVAYIVAKPEQTTPVDALRTFLKEKLPAHMVPSFFLVIEKMPLTPNGKIDRKALPSPENAAVTTGFLAPGDPLEQMLAQIWSKILKVERIGIRDNFFELGGHSLLAVRILAEIERLLKKSLTLATFLQGQTIGELADALRKQDCRPSRSPLKRISRDIELPLSSAQMQLWLFDQLEPGSSAYNIPVRYDFRGAFDIAVLDRSLSEIVRRHEVLRTGYLSVDGSPVQKIYPPAPFRVSIVDLQGLPEAAREREVASRATAFARQPFDLGKVPLLRAQVLKLAPEEHVLLVNFHHVACDWWSFGVFEKELATLYDAFLRGEENSPLPDLDVQYVDFTAWQQEQLQEEILQEQLDYWRTKLSGELPTLELPTDRPRPAIQTYNGTFVCSALSQNLTEALKTLSQQEGTTLFATLLGAFQVLLQRYTGEDDVLVGVPIAGRNRAEVEGLMGFFVNTLALRNDLSGDPTFRELLRRVQETALGAYSHQDLSFEKLVEALNPKRDSSRSPMFQVMLSMLNMPMQPLQLPGLQHRRTILDSGTSKFDLTLYAIEEPTGLSFTCEYNTDLFDSDRIHRMLGHLQVLLEGIVADPDRRLSQLPLLSNEERKQILIEWNDTQQAYPQDVLLHELFERQAERTPEAVAIESDGNRLTYSELNRRANQLAGYLKTEGVGSDTLVAVCMERSLDMVIALLGVLKAGGAYVPLDPAYPTERLAFMVEDARVHVLLTRDGTIAGPADAGHRPKIVCMDSDAAKFAQQSSANPASTAASTSLAYVIYTSGSTGKSKGVQISHRAVVNFLTSMRRQPGLAEEDVLLSVTTLSFDIAALEIFLPLTVGARLVLVSREVASDGPRLSEQLAKSDATVMQATPATWRLLLEAGWQGSQQLKILCGGEALDRELANRLLKKCSALWNMYGPTETTIWSAACKIEPESEFQSEIETSSVAIGRPIANTQFYLLDRHLQPVPVGVTGELHIGGEGLARGYLNRPELTAEKFIPNPFTGGSEAQLSARLYKTGDLGRYLPDGSIDFLGRNDYQVKIRGFRIELGEIEAALDRHPSVQKAVVLAREDAPGEKRLVAYIVPKSEQTASVDALRTFLKEKLPAHMVPSFFLVMEKMPLTPNGKIDRKALPSPEHAAVTTGFLAPRDPLEQMLAQIWSKILKVKRIGIQDNFFELGGHSLLAVRIMAEIERLLQRSLPLATFLQAPTVAELADVLRKKDWKPSWSSLVPLRAGGSKPPLFLMHSHGGNVLEYYPLAESLEADQPVYALQARGLDGRIVKDQCFEEMVEAHLTELRSLQPEGPYFLGGYCLGGLLALEAARQLRALGEEVGLVVLIQTINPTFARFSPDLTIMHRAWYRAAKRIDLELAYLHHRGGSHILERCRRTWDIAVARTAITFDNWKDDGRDHRRGTLTAHTLELLAIEHERARRRYELRPYNGPVLLFRASRQISGLMADSNLGWKDVLTGKLSVCEVPGHQETMLLEPNVSYLAKELTAQLQAVQHSPLAT